jgi:type I restriction enzyme S subunit
MDLLERHFEIALETPEGIKKLRELILSLAMKGKLVRQDEREGTAGELIKEIETEKNQLMNEGQIRAQESLPEVNESSAPFRIPKGWQWVRLGELTQKIGSGSTPRGGKNVYTKEGIPFLRSQNIRDDSIKLDDVAYITKETHDNMSNTKVCPKDILLNITGASLGRSAVVPDDFTEANVSQHVTIIRLVKPDCRKYLHFFILSSICQSMIWGRQVGMAREGLSKKVLEQFEIPLPPLPEQYRIVAKINQLMSLCDKLEAERNERNNKRHKIHTAAINKLLSATDKTAFNSSWNFITKNFSELYSIPENVEELKKAILQLAVMGKLVKQDPEDQPASELLKEIEKEKMRLMKEGKIKKQEPLPEITQEENPYEVPKGWVWKRLCDLVDVGTGSTPQKGNKEYYNGKIPWYTSSATNNIIAEMPRTFITEKAIRETNCKIFPQGSLIIALYGQGKTRGQISEIAIPGATNQAIAAMVFFESSRSIKDYLKYYFLKIYAEIRLLAEGAAQPNLNVGKIKNTLIPLPPLPEQHRIVSKINALMSLCDTLEQEIKNSTDKKTAILNAVLAKL